MASPANIIVTPMYIGLRENLKRPVTTKYIVGSAGDNVPLPLTAKLIMQVNITTKPIKNTIAPA